MDMDILVKHQLRDFLCLAISYCFARAASDFDRREKDRQVSKLNGQPANEALVQISVNASSSRASRRAGLQVLRARPDVDHAEETLTISGRPYEQQF